MENGDPMVKNYLSSIQRALICLTLIGVLQNLGCAFTKHDVLTSQNIFHEDVSTPGHLRFAIYHEKVFSDVKTHLNTKQGNTIMVGVKHSETVSSRTVKDPVVNVAVEVTLPQGEKITAYSDTYGVADFTLPDDPARYFPIRFFARVHVPQVTGYGDYDAEIPLSLETIALFPSSVKDKIKQLESALTDAKSRYEALKMEEDSALKETKGAYEASQAEYEGYLIGGTIIDWDDKNLLLYGRAVFPLAKETLGAGFQPYDDYLVIRNYNRSKAIQQRNGSVYYQNIHHFIGKFSRGNDFFGRTVPTNVYGDPPNEKEMDAAHRAWADASSRYKVPLQEARDSLRQALAAYEANLPSDPFGFDVKKISSTVEVDESVQKMFERRR